VPVGAARRVPHYLLPGWLLVRALLETAGEVLAIDSGTTRFATLIEETVSGARLSASSDRESSVLVRVESDSRPFDVTGWNTLAWSVVSRWRRRDARRLHLGIRSSVPQPRQTG
jgi:hypothetical protein